MAELIPSNRYTAVLGPIKMEIINIASAGAATVVTADANGNPSSTLQIGADDLDTVKTLMQRPMFALGAITSDAVSITQSFNVGISGKTLTLNATDLAADDVVMLVFGF